MDLSVAGMGAIFNNGSTPPLHSRVQDIQLSLRGVRLMVNGIVMGARDDTGMGEFRLIMFEPASLDEEKRHKLRAFIGRVQQAAMMERIATA